MNTVYKTQNGELFNCTQAQADILKKLEQTNKGGFANLQGYIAKSKRDKPETADYTLLTRFNKTRLYNRKIEALKNISFDDVKKLSENDSKLSKLSYNDLLDAFNKRKTWEIERMEKSNAGTLNNSKTDAHERNYSHVCDGVKVNYQTEKIDGIQRPILTDGLPTVQSIMLSGLTVNKKVIDAGQFKKVNSGVPVRISNCLNKLLNQRSVGLKTFSLKPENFKRLRISKDEILPKHLEDFAI